MRSMDDIDFDENKFIAETTQLGIVAPDRRDNLWRLAKHCAKTVGLPTGGGFAVLGAGAGTVSVGALTVPGWAVGFLVGLATGTSACVALNLSASKRATLQELSRRRPI